MRLNILKQTIVALSISLLITSCGILGIGTNREEREELAEIETLENAHIFSISKDEKAFILDGVINHSALEDFKRLQREYPEVKQINIKNCDGSIDDEINLQLALLVHHKQFDIHLTDNGLVASGGTDFFLAGKHRTCGKNTRFGVHSWAGSDDEGKEFTAKDFPEEHENHQPYIKYYENIGFSPKEARAFYFFTINAASAEDIHWMSPDELKQYKVINK